MLVQFLLTLTAFILPLLLTAHLSARHYATDRTEGHAKEKAEPTPTRTYTITYPDGTEVICHDCNNSRI